MPTIRMRYSGPLESAPMIGGYILSASRPRGGYLITGVRNLGRRGGLGEPVHYALVIETERCSVADTDPGPVWTIRWDSRGRRRRRAHGG